MAVPLTLPMPPSLATGQATYKQGEASLAHARVRVRPTSSESDGSSCDMT